MRTAPAVTDAAFAESLERVETFLAVHEHETDGERLQHAVDVLCAGFGLTSERRELLIERLAHILPPMFSEQAASCLVVGALIGLMAADSAALSSAD